MLLPHLVRRGTGVLCLRGGKDGARRAAKLRCRHETDLGRVGGHAAGLDDALADDVEPQLVAMPQGPRRECSSPLRHPAHTHGAVPARPCP